MSNNDNYKLIKFSSTKKTFKDTLLGSDIGVHSNGFVSIFITSFLVAIGVILLMYFSFRI